LEATLAALTADESAAHIYEANDVTWQASQAVDHEVMYLTADASATHAAYAANNATWQESHRVDHEAMYLQLWDISWMHA